MSENVILTGGPPWGFRILGTASKTSNIVISQVNPGSPASKAGLKSRDIIQAINGIVLTNCNLDGAQEMIKASQGNLHLQIKLASVWDIHPCQAQSKEPEMVKQAKNLEKPRPIGKKGAYGNLVTIGREFESVRSQTPMSEGSDSSRWRVRNAKDFCKACGNPILDKEYLSVKQDHFHSECFVCAATNCSNNLIEGYFMEQNRCYCSDCHQKYFSKLCIACQKPIFKDAFRALNLQWHIECFLCIECKNPPLGGVFHLENGNIYCNEDHEKLFKVFCWACQKPIVAGQSEIDIMDKKWHDYCFNCSKCRRNLNGKRFVRRGGTPRCPHCK